MRLTYKLLLGISVLALSLPVVAQSLTEPQATLQDMIEAAQQGDWGSVDQLLTTRLYEAVQPGTLPVIWQTLGTDIEVIDQQVVGRTAHLWVKGTMSLAQAAQISQIPPDLLPQWLEDPEWDNPQYRQQLTQLSALTLTDNGSVKATTRLTFYQQQEDWKLESLGLFPDPSVEMPTPPEPEGESPSSESEPSDLE